MSESSENCRAEDGPNPSGFKSYMRIFKFADRTSWILYSVAFAAAIAAGAALPLMDLVFGKFVMTFNNFAIGAVSPDDYMTEVSRYSLYFVYLFIAKFFLVYIHTVCVSTAAIRATKALRLDFLQSLLRQDMSYFDSEDTGSPSVKVTTNGNLVTSGISEKLSIFIQSCSTFVVAFIVAFVVQWKLTLITICVVPTIVIVTGVCMTIEVKSEDKLMDIFSRASLLAEDVFSSISTVHAFWLQPTMAKRYGKFLAEMERVGMKKSPNYGVLFATEFFCVYSGYGLAFWQGLASSGGWFLIISLRSVIFAVVLAATSLTQIAPQIIIITKAAAAADELFRIIDKESAIDPLSSAGLTPEKCVGEIEVRAIEFSYPSRPDTKVLDGLSLSVPAGKTTAVVGASGSGKSTIVGLLERWYDPAAGMILFDDLDIQKLNIAWLRTQIRLVQQEPVLFSGSIFDNVAFGLEGTQYAGASYEEKLALVKEACQNAYAHEFIDMLPKGYDTQIGERARMLSGGQKQRIAIARSIISRPSVLLLDEATSALDPKAEKIVQSALDNISVGRTTITIAHKLSTVQKADNIVVISAGRLIEQGTHHELIAKDGAYARLVRAQDLENSKGKATEQPESDNVWSEEKDDPKSAARLSLHRTRSGGVQAVDVTAQPLAQETMGYSTIRCLWLLIKDQRDLWGFYAMFAFVCVLGGGTFPAQAVIFAKTLQVFQMSDSEIVARGDFWALMFFVVALANFFLYFILGWSANFIIQKVSRRYRRELFRNTLKQEIAFFDLEHNATGAICARLLTHAWNINELLGVNSGLILINVVTVIAVSVLGIAYGWKLGLVCVFAALPPLLLSGYLRIRLEYKLEEDISARFASSAAIATEAISAIRTVASLTLEKKMLEIYRERLDISAEQSMKALTFTMLWYALTQSINFLVMALGFWYGGKLISTGEYTNEQFFVVFIAVVLGGENAAALFQYTTSITKATGSTNYIFWLRQRVPTIDNSFSDDEPTPDEFSKDTKAVAVDCRALDFAYPSRPRSNVISGVSVNIPPGKFIAFVGPSGCGKSTMINLLSRFYDPTSGYIAIDDQPIHDTTPQEHRRRLALVQQEPVLYQGSIGQNVAMGLVESKEATEAQIEQACKDANIFDFVLSLPEGLGTEVGSRGAKLSGGQRQRIAIARALIRDPEILLLDEATSALDTESEKIVQAALSEAAKDGKRTTIAVAHRLSTVKDADCIFVFQAGRIVEAGSLVELLTKRGIYYNMCQGQVLDKALG
ncbi:hypothetical protein G7Z17_g3861 [Cylindrodendrum hubeiense]|uniref:Uncharacterized protein n=1 Tax=Cylindrodendrum hubeiense TaxID=595255 RepID=A0A9P5LJI4_9HYPO|nr:hypothetical protein G7Z17_g3861 [Cylindrodendrum hubeiense]